MGEDEDIKKAFEDIAKGRFKKFKSIEELFTDLDEPIEEIKNLNKVIFINGYPWCSEDGAMNKVSPHGMWRCLTCHIGWNEETKEFLSSSKEGYRKDLK